VVVVILAIAAAILIPAAVRTGDLEIVAATRVMAADLQYAQDHAITSQSPVTVTFDVAGNSYRLTNESGNLINPITKTAYVTSFATEQGFDQLEIVSAAFGEAPSVTFDELGSPNAAGSVVVRAGGFLYQVAVASATGKVTVTDMGS